MRCGCDQVGFAAWAFGGVWLGGGIGAGFDVGVGVGEKLGSTGRLGLAEASTNGVVDGAGAAATPPPHAAIVATAAKRMSIDPARADVVRIVIFVLSLCAVDSAPTQRKDVGTDGLWRRCRLADRPAPDIGVRTP
jgi:hypothetical protein